MVFFNFLNFFAFFLEFSILRRIGTERNDNFHFLPFWSSFKVFWLEMEVLFNFLNFFAIFLQFSITRHVRTGRNETIIFIFSVSHPLSTDFGLKWSHNGIFSLFFEFYCYFFGIFHNASARNETKRNDNFYFLSFLAFSKLFWLEMMP